MGNKHTSGKSREKSKRKRKDRLCDACALASETLHFTSMMVAARDGHQECIRWMLEVHRRNDELEYHVDLMTKDNKSPLLLAIQNGHHECVELLIQAGATMDGPAVFPPVLEAVRSIHPRCIDVLLGSGADAGLEWYSINDMLSTAQEDQEACMEVLRALGCQRNTPLSVGEAALITAVANCYVPCVISLLHAGVEVNTLSHLRTSALIVAAAAGSRGLACTKLLLKVGVFVNQTNLDDLNALQIAIARGKGTKRDRQKCVLLFVAGEYLESMDTEFTYTGQTFIVPEFLKQLVREFSLKNFCRKVIRNQLILVNPYLHLFGRIPELRQPSVITSYLLYEMSLE